MTSRSSAMSGCTAISASAMSIPTCLRRAPSPSRPRARSASNQPFTDVLNPDGRAVQVAAAAAAAPGAAGPPRRRAESATSARPPMPRCRPSRQRTRRPTSRSNNYRLLAAEPEPAVRPVARPDPALRGLAGSWPGPISPSSATSCDIRFDNNTGSAHDDRGQSVPQTGLVRPVRPYPRMVFRTGRLADDRRLLQADPQFLLPEPSSVETSPTTG